MFCLFDGLQADKKCNQAFLRLVFADIRLYSVSVELCEHRIYGFIFPSRSLSVRSIILSGDSFSLGLLGIFFSEKLNVSKRLMFIV